MSIHSPGIDSVSESFNYHKSKRQVQQTNKYVRMCLILNVLCTSENVQWVIELMGQDKRNVTHIVLGSSSTRNTRRAGTSVILAHTATHWLIALSLYKQINYQLLINLFLFAAEKRSRKCVCMYTEILSIHESVLVRENGRKLASDFDCKWGRESHSALEIQLWSSDIWIYHPIYRL